MKKRIYKYLGILLPLTLSISLMAASVCAAENEDTLKAGRELAGQELDELEKLLAEVLIRLDTIECNIIEERVKLNELEGQYKELGKKLSVQYEEMRLRIQFMYENSTGGQMDVFLSGTDLASLINRAEYIQSISQYDRDKLEEYANLVRDVNLLKEALAEKLAEQERLQEELEAEQRELDALIEEKEAEIEDIEQKILTAMAAAQKEREEEQKRIQMLEAEQEKKQDEQIGEPITEQVTETPTEPVTERITEAVTEPITEQVMEEVTEPITEQVTEEVTEPITEQVTEAAAEPETEQPESPTEQASLQPDVVAMAYQLIGTRYLAGGAGPDGFDCSGFTYYLYSQIGITLPRTSSGQTTGGTAVASLEEAQPGDIICYPGHVGLYVGNNQIIHATVPGDTVKLSSVYYSSWQKVVAIRRYW